MENRQHRVYKSGLMRHVEDTVGMPLEELLPLWYAEGLSGYRIARRLYQEYGIDVTDQTIREWARRFGGRRVMTFGRERSRT